MEDAHLSILKIFSAFDSVLGPVPGIANPKLNKARSLPIPGDWSARKVLMNW